MDRMTHPTEAVDAVAQVLALQSVTVQWWAENGEKYGDPWRDIARALLDRIAPLLIAAEREACAMVTDDHTPDKHTAALASHVTGRAIAAAIRERSKA